MKLSDIKGEKALDIMADVMELAEIVADDERIKALADELNGKDEDKAWRVFCKHLAPILREKRYKQRIISILACAAGMEYDDYAKDGPILADLFELLTSDADTLGFLLGSSASRE